MRVLDNGDSYSEYLAALAFGKAKYRPDILVPKLITMLDDHDRWVRKGAAEALGSYGPTAIEGDNPLLTLIENEEDEEIRMIAIEAIGRMGSNDEVVVHRLFRLLKFGERRGPEKARIIDSLSLVGSQAEVLPSFFDLLKTSDDETRISVVSSLRNLGGSPEVIKTLLDALKDDSPEVQEGALRSLAFLGGGARNALPGLKRLAKSTEDKELKWAILNAIEAIERDVGK